MSISYKEFKYPECWKRNPNSNNQYFEEVFKDSIKVGIYEIKNQKHYSYMEDIVGICRYFYPTIDNEQSILCGTFMNWLFLIDDFLEDDKNITSKKQNEILKIHENILLTGQYLNSDVEPTICEKLTMLLQTTLNQWAIKYNKLDMYNILITTLIQWMYSVNPLNKIVDSSKPIHMDLYTFIRKYNCGVTPSIAVVLFVDKEINDVDFSKIWLNPIFARILENSSMHVALVNDCASYSREFNFGVHKVNPLYFLQINHNLSYVNIFKLIANICNQRINQIIKDEELLLKQLKQQGYTENQLNQVNIILNYIHFIIQGNIGFSISSKRYNSTDQENETIFKKNISYYI
ncbi:hypothetical protein ACTFIZ_000181 [Dictyostelium cf. discoideum]